ncbi:hypothetical protein Pfo_018121 [Paulownia fortunei]|nr:hypothetical protein Pfo_018121 [Paulownia fortunei]
MTQLPTHVPSSPTTTTTYDHKTAQNPIEIISEEKMALVKAACAAICPLSSTRPPTLSAPLLSSGSQGSGRVVRPYKKNGAPESFLQRFRRGRGLSITDFTGTEWCEKQMEFNLRFGRTENTKAMKAGTARHVALEEEVITRVKVHVESAEDVWALKFMKFIFGANQLLCNGLTRELPIISFAEGLWMVGNIDEICMTESKRFPILVEMKTRAQATLPGEPQRRNGRFQLMCYKYMWDNSVADNFPLQKFFDFFSLNPNHILSPEIRENTAKSDFPSETLNDLVMHFRNSCCLLPRADDQLLLRHSLILSLPASVKENDNLLEPNLGLCIILPFFEEDQSLLGEEQFAYDPDWLKGQIKSCLEFWLGEREARYTPREERWKCRLCKFASICPANSRFTMQKKKE